MEAEENKLVRIVEESGVEKTKAQQILEHFTHLLNTSSEWETKAKAIKITDVSQTREMKMAREGRLALRDIRLDAEKLKKRLKEGVIAEGKLIDSIYNSIEAVTKPLESYLMEQEKYAEMLEKKRKEELKATREMLLAPYQIDTSFYNLSDMPEETFTTLLDSTKVAHEQKLEAQRRAEEELIKKEKASAIHDERKNKLLPYWNFVPLNHKDTDFSTLTEEEFNERFEWTVNEKKKNDEEQERIRKENERLKAEAEEKERQLEKERLAAEAEKNRIAEEEKKKREEIEAKAEKEREESEAKLKAEREAKEKLEAELNAKKEAEEKTEKERLAAEEKQKKQAEKLAKAPIQKQLNLWVDSFVLPPFATQNDTADNIFKKFEAFKVWAKKEIENV